MSRVATSPLPKSMPDHIPVPSLYAPSDGFELSNDSPAGRLSLTSTLLAASGPLLVRVIVNVTLSPTVGFELSTDFSSERSADSTGTSTR